MLIMNIITGIGFTAMIGGFIYVGRKLQILDDLKITSDKIKGNVKVIGDFLTRNTTNFNRSELAEHPEITQ